MLCHLIYREFLRLSRGASRERWCRGGEKPYSILNKVVASGRPYLGTPSSSLASHAGGGRTSYDELAMQGKTRASIARHIAPLVPLAKLELGVPSG